MAELPPDAGAMMSAVRDERRLRILLAVEDTPMGAADLARHLDLPFDKVNWAVKSLVRTGLLGLERYEVAGPRNSALAKVYTTRHTGWDGLVRALSKIGATRRDVAPPNL